MTALIAGIIVHILVIGSYLLGFFEQSFSKLGCNEFSVLNVAILILVCSIENFLEELFQVLLFE